MNAPDPQSRLPRICIVGGGAGGIELATQLGRRLGRKAEILLIDRNALHLWKPRLHEVAAGLIGEDEAVGYLGHSVAHNYQFHFGSLIGIDPAAQTIHLSAVHSRHGDDEILPERSLAYDLLVLGLGSQVNDFGIAGVRDYCTMLDSTAQAVAFQQKFLEATVQVTEGQKPRVSVGIVGAGATGVELAAELYHAAHDLKRFGGLSDQGKLDITLVDGADRILPATDQRTSQAITRNLQRLGVKLILGDQVDHVTKDALHLKSGQIVPCELKVWASGVVVKDLASILPALELLRGGRIKVDEYLRCTGVENIYAMGDCAAATNENGPLPPTAQVAHQQAGYLAHALSRRLQQKPAKPFRYQPRGTLISLGAFNAVGEIPLSKSKAPLRINGSKTKFLYVALYQMHRVALFGWLRTGALIIADWLRRRTVPPVKLH